MTDDPDHLTEANAAPGEANPSVHRFESNRHGDDICFIAEMFPYPGDDSFGMSVTLVTAISGERCAPQV